MKIYGGIYQQGPSAQTDQFLTDETQLKMDGLLLPYYLWETMAHNMMLAGVGLVPPTATHNILTALIELEQKVIKKEWQLDPQVGDLHENVEAWLSQSIGPDAGWFHLARSRNDQISCDQKLLTKALFFELGQKINTLGAVLAQLSQQNAHAVMPGFTHLRAAMPSSFGFWAQSYLLQLIEVEELLRSTYDLTNSNPLGAGASYGVNWPIDPDVTTTYLGFGRPLTNSLASINNRGLHELHWLHGLVSLATIFSRMMEDLIIWSLPEVGLVNISESFTSGSSIMPQKMNPDVAEKIRSKTGLFLGKYVQMVTTLKGTPSGYNRDSADSKSIIITAVTDTVQLVDMTSALLGSLKLKTDHMLQATQPTLATKLADLIAHQHQIPFRQVHLAVGSALKEVDHDLTQLSAKTISTHLDIEISAKWLQTVLDPHQALAQYHYLGSPQPKMVKKATRKLLKKHKQFGQWLTKEQSLFDQAKLKLQQDVMHYLETDHD